VKLTAVAGRPASLAQSGLAVKKGMTYAFSGFLRTDTSDVRAEVVLIQRELEQLPERVNLFETPACRN